MKQEFAGYEIVMAGDTGSAGVLQLIARCGDALARRFPAFILADGESAARRTVMETEKAFELLDDAGPVYRAGASGIMAALWEMGEWLGTGLEADLRTLPIRQETIEICEYLDEDPYELDSTGVLLIASRSPRRVCSHFARFDVPARSIGILTDTGGKVVMSAGHRRFLNRPGRETVRLGEEA